MKKTSKIFSIVLAAVLVLAMAVPAFAAGTGVIEIKNAEVEHNYSIYKMLDFTPSSADEKTGIYKIASGWENFFSGETAQNYFTVNADKIVALKEGVTAVDATLAKAAIDYANTNSITATKTAEATSETLQFTELDLGYYAVDTTLGTICSLTKTSNTATAIEKNSKPVLEKKIVEGSKRVDANNVAIGDTVTYEATITVGNGAVNYVMHDKMSDGLTFGAITSVKSGETDVAYTLKRTELTDGCDFEVVFDNAAVAALAADSKIVVTYTATLNAEAEVGATGNTNEAWLSYSEDNDFTHETVKDIVITYTAKLVVNKVDGNGDALEGAGFTLYKDGEAVGTELKTGSEFVWTGLEAGNYKLVETTVPAGYNKAADIEFTIICDVPAEVTTGTETATWTSNNDDVKFDGSINAYETTVENLTGALLPETGGIGTTIFYIVGGLLIVGAVILLITKKRMAAQA